MTVRSTTGSPNHSVTPPCFSFFIALACVCNCPICSFTCSRSVSLPTAHSPLKALLVQGCVLTDQTACAGQALVKPHHRCSAGCSADTQLWTQDPRAPEDPHGNAAARARPRPGAGHCALLGAQGFPNHSRPQKQGKALQLPVTL